MKAFVDLHNHLLPGIDDGARDVEMAVAMARQAVDDGIEYLVCTPHIQPGRFDNNWQTIRQAEDVFKSALSEAGVPLKVACAAEVHFGLEIMAGVEHATLPYLGKWRGKDVLLLEFPHGLVPHGADILTDWLLRHDVVPMIAHPERNRGFIAAPEKLKPFIRQGCLLQVTASSLTGRFGQSALRLGEGLIREHKVTVLASDAHDTEVRPPLLSEGKQRAAALVGEKAAQRLVSNSPWLIVRELFE